MPTKILFTNVQLIAFARTQREATAKFSAALTQPVLKAMAWDDVPEFLTGASLEGKLNATHGELIPADKELKHHSIDIELSQASDFQTVRLELEGKKGKGHRIELRFKLTFADGEACAKLEQYMQTIGQAKSKLSIGYSVQTALDMGPSATDEQSDAVSEEND